MLRTRKPRAGAAVVEGGEAVSPQMNAQGVDVDGPDVVLVVGGHEEVRSSSASTESGARVGSSRENRSPANARTTEGRTTSNARWRTRCRELYADVRLGPPPATIRRALGGHPLDAAGGTALASEGDAVALVVARVWFRARRRSGARAVDVGRLEAALRRWM
jgi:hypothetical protein